jgi:ribosomal-protein-alanine N-acetyltransferase
MINLDLNVRAASPDDQNRIANLIYFEPYVHRHLDWGTPIDWLGPAHCWVIEKNGRINAALACPPDPKWMAWLRLFVTNNLASMHENWQVLWEAARLTLSNQRPMTVGVIVMHDWLAPLLHDSGFQLLNQIVMLDRTGAPPVAHPLAVDVRFRPLVEADLPAIAELDAAAFDPLWQNSLAMLRKAYPQSALTTVAEDQAGHLIGYQLSTRNSIGAHLARLAVHPQQQGRGLGYALVQGLLNDLARLGIQRLSVNTQSDNRASLALYQKLNFTRTREEYPVYVASL